MSAINKEIYRGKEVEVAALRTYLNEVQAIAVFPLEDKGRTIKIAGSGKPRLRLSLKFSPRFGKELELLFMGERKEEKYTHGKGFPQTTFGNIILHKEDLKNLIHGLLEVYKEWEKGGKTNGK